VVTVPTTPEKAKKEGSHSKISGEKITRPWDIYLEENKGKWKELSIKGDKIHLLHLFLFKEYNSFNKIFFFLFCFLDQQRRQEEAKLKPED
jgi:hypothetical protein